MQRTILIEQRRFRPSFFYLSVRVSVTFRHCIKTAQRIQYRHLDMVEIISSTDVPIILVFRQLITVTKFGLGHQQLNCLDLILSNHAVAMTLDDV